MRKILLSISFVVALMQTNFSQDSLSRIQNKEKVLAIGVDISSPLGRFFETGWNNYELSATYGRYKNLLFSFEAGNMDYSISKREYDYNADGKFLNILVKKDDFSPSNRPLTRAYDYYARGQYMRLGADFNVFKRNKPGEQNLVFFGARYGFSNTSFHANNIFIMDSVWQPHTGFLPESSIASHWFEALGGIRVQFTSYFSMGWTFRYKIFLYSNNKNNKPYFISGYGKGNNNTSLGITYSLFFTLPFQEKTALKSKM